ncbi:phosphoribosyl-ATP pyrophosphohydrolase [Angulomicrobium tetraedrale]|uniref:phosphoribosyl-ATP diphosphatase n=1 Tax=Ancylobacter tetraedralis TaxID=217068 RepID=A0A839Z2X8_9HYPH|nr:phosphoribosyl-ATP diphosphatase [Ancylobacter tetraedralis]MBB3771064.1 phosphoribosyl-ATP pyrophosphohydrolase [Ancylobacter tetraedralis]
MSDSIRRLHDAVIATRRGNNTSARTARLFAKGRPFIAKKVAEEAVEVALDGVVGNVPATVCESADLLYNLVVLWVDLGIDPDDVWTEMARRENLLGMAEKLPKRARKGAGGDAGPSSAPPTDAPVFDFHPIPHRAASLPIGEAGSGPARRR